MTQLPEVLAAVVRGRGVASVAVIERAGAEPRVYWDPDYDHEPAFLAYSVTKTFTAALILTLCDDGLLRLDDRLARWYPSVAHADRISLRQLLNHTAGIPDYGASHAYQEGVRSSPSSPWSFARFAAETFDDGLAFEPGEGWAYSNPGYMLLRRVAEDVTGMPYRALISERIARPLGRAFHAFDLGRASVCAMSAIEGVDAEGVVFDLLDQMATRGR